MKSFQGLGEIFPQNLIDKKKNLVRNYHTPSSFSDWVFENDKGKLSDQSRKNESTSHGNELHQKLQSDAYDKFRTDEFLNELGGVKRRDLRLIYRDLDKADSLAAKPLEFGGKNFLCKPDFVCECRDTKTTYIFEHKYTARSLSALPALLHDLWLNIACQVWCYAQIDDFNESPKVRLITTFWNRQSHVSFRPIKSYIWDYNSLENKVLEGKCDKWFQTYKNWVTSQLDL